MEPKDTLEFLRAGWPVVVAIVGIIIWMASEATMNKSTRADFKDFKEKTYPNDQDGWGSAIKEVREAQERSEARIEAKLDKISDQSNAQLEKVYSKINESNILLARLEGRLSNSPQVHESKT